DMGTWTYEYDAVGNLKKQTDAKGQVLTFEYDVLNRLTSKQGLSTVPVALATYFYDDTSKDNCIGRLSKVTDQSGSTEFFYDKLGREIKSIKGLSPQGTVPEQQFTVLREYDILNRLTKLTYPDGEAVQYTYDSNSGLLEKVFTVDGGLSTVDYINDTTYNAKGQIKIIQYGNGTQTDYTYGQDLRLSRILTRSPANPQTLQDLNYLFDKNGNVATLTDNLKSNIRTFSYDDLDRLTQAQNVPAPGGGYTNFNYEYDSIGNMTYKSDVGVMSYGEGLSPQGTVPKPHALTSAGGYTYQYDANGNMTVGKNKTLTYDAEDRLLQVNELGIITSFAYDGDGGRVKKTVSLRVAAAAGGNEAISTTYIGSLFEIQGSGDGVQRTVKHIFAGANRVASVSLRGSEATEAISYYHTDHLGSSSVITDTNGNQVEHYEYTPYGSFATNSVIASPDGAKQSSVSHLFTGKELDATGLYYYGARYYDPEIGRFISADTIVQAPYDPQSLNRYSYCRNNPINYVDPSGHIWFIPLIIAAIIGAGVGAAVAAATSSDIGAGAIMGAISGALFWGAGQAISGLATALKIQSTAMMTALKTGVHAFTGAASGALGAVATGGDSGFAAAIGGISAGASAWVGGVFPIAGNGLGAFAAEGLQRTAVGAILGGGTSLVMGGNFGAGATQGAQTSAIAYMCNETMHAGIEKAKDALNTSKDKSELAPTDVNKNDGACSSCDSGPRTTAEFKWYDPSSLIFPGTNYCGITRSGPGQPTSRIDTCCQRHDECLRNSKGRWWLPGYKVLDCHDDLFNCIEMEH
ncbi:MAG: RHS repeat-associated core domain-containing protein, partial [Candidatus Omnitrophota bacterium]